jgi:hypothetical protein
MQFLDEDNFLATAQCSRCNREDSYYATWTNGIGWVIEDCSTCGAEGQFFLKIAEVA